MNNFVKAIKTHPFTVIFYLFYLWLVIRDINITENYRELEKALKQGEELPHMEWGGFLEAIFATIFCLTMGAKAISSSKDQMWFYLCMIVFIVVPFIIMINY